MKKLTLLLLFGALAGGLAAQAQTTPPKTFLKVGDEAPDFTLKSTKGETVCCLISAARRWLCSPSSRPLSPVAERRK